MKAETLAWK